MNTPDRERRRLLMAMTGVAGASFLPWTRLAAAAGKGPLAVTPADAEGPFYPVVVPEDRDNDLMSVMDMAAISPGQVAYVHGSVQTRDGQPIDGARVEIWQCDHEGVYFHPDDPGEPDARFQGFGAMVTDRDGKYHFRTLRPVPYAGRTPHIHFRVNVRGRRRLTTQLYVAEEQQLNAEDLLYQRHSPAQRAAVTRSFSPVSGVLAGPVAARFDIVLG